MRKFILGLLALLFLLPAHSQHWDIQLPEYSVEAVTFAYEGQTTDWGVHYLKSAEFWSKSRGQGAIGFILDTGVETGHPDLKDRVILEYCKDFTGSAVGFQDIHGHGTHCAGITAASDNALGVVGNAPQASIVAIKVLNDQGSGSFQTVALGIRYVADLVLTNQHAGKKKVISMSLGGGGGAPELEAAIAYAISKGVFIVAAAGNSGCNIDNTIGYPGRYPSVITVASIGKTELPSGFSSCGEQIDVSAPGEQIYSTGKGGGYVYLSGTSMATPGVAGVICNIVSAYPQIKTQADLEKYLRAKAKDLPPTGWDKRTGYGSTVMTGYLVPPDGSDNPPPPPPGDPVRAFRTITIPIAGQYSFIWKGANETTFHRATVSEIVIDAKTNRWSDAAIKNAIQKTDAFFANGNRGFGLLDDADLYEAGRWCAYFLALLTRDERTTLFVRGMTVQDEVGNTLWFDGQKDKARDLPAAAGLFHSRKSKAAKVLKDAARDGATTFAK
jgi:subtilisin